jgi:hypothetical protein
MKSRLCSAGKIVVADCVSMHNPAHSTSATYISHLDCANEQFSSVDASCRVILAPLQRYDLLLLERWQKCNFTEF